MLQARWYFTALLWLQMLALEQASGQVQAGLHDFLQLRYALLDDPSAAIAAHCAALAGPLDKSSRARWCQLDLHWWRGRGREYEICSDTAAGAVGLGLASPRRYRILLACQLPLHGLGGSNGFNDSALRLPLLSATLFR